MLAICIALFICGSALGQQNVGSSAGLDGSRAPAIPMAPSIQLSSFEPHNAGIGDLITLTFSNAPDGFVKSMEDTNKLVLLLGEIPFRNIGCDVLKPAPGTVKIRFNLAFGANNRSEWSEIIRRQRAGESISVGLATSDGTEYPCFGDSASLNLIVMDRSQKFLAAALLLLFVYVFFYLATQTEMIRDSDRSLPPNLAVQAKKPQKSARREHNPFVIFLCLAFAVGAVLLAIWLDHNTSTILNVVGISQLFIVAIFASVVIHYWIFWKPPAARAAAKMLNSYSLARTQMAIWFFLAVCSWVFLWLVTGTLNTLSETVLALMGIGAGTALGAEVQDAGKPTYPELVDTKIKDLEDKQATQTATPTDLTDLAKLKVDLQAELAKPPPVSDGFFADVLTDASSGISFHRFQMFIWTIVLGIVFAVEVYQHLTMPDFDGTMLALMGISSGTYLGFMIKEPHSSQQTIDNSKTAG
jgi:hypothetical protein